VPSSRDVLKRNPTFPARFGSYTCSQTSHTGFHGWTRTVPRNDATLRIDVAPARGWRGSWWWSIQTAPRPRQAPCCRWRRRRVVEAASAPQARLAPPPPPAASPRASGAGARTRTRAPAPAPRAACGGARPEADAAPASDVRTTVGSVEADRHGPRVSMAISTVMSIVLGVGVGFRYDRCRETLAQK